MSAILVPGPIFKIINNNVIDEYPEDHKNFLNINVDENLVSLKILQVPLVSEWYLKKEIEFQNKWRKKGVQLCTNPSIIIEVINRHDDNVIYRDVLPFTFDFSTTISILDLGNYFLTYKIIYFNRKKDDFEVVKYLLKSDGIINKKYHEIPFDNEEPNKPFWNMGIFPIFKDGFEFEIQQCINPLMRLFH